MILLDYNQIAIASVMAQTRQDKPDENLIRHMVLNSIRNIRNKFKNDFGELVICCDTGNYWRKDKFPFYKASRKQKQKKSDFDWGLLFSILGKVREELDLFFPYKVLHIERCEADDVIATLCKKYHQSEKIVIVSSDKDFQQLQRYENVRQWNPIKNSFVKCSDPEKFLQDLIIRGDSSDGVPNALSEDDCLVDPEKRQKPLTKKMLAYFHDNFLNDKTPDEYRETLERNQLLVDFGSIPDEYTINILEEYDKKPQGNRSRLFNYFIAKRLKVLMENIQEF
jgi:5'-3' exonuclease